MMVATYSADSAFDVQGVERLFDSSPYSRNNDRTWHYYDVTSDDQRFVMVRPESSGDDESARLILVQNFFEELEQRVGN